MLTAEPSLLWLFQFAYSQEIGKGGGELCGEGDEMCPVKRAAVACLLLALLLCLSPLQHEQTCEEASEETNACT